MGGKAEEGIWGGIATVKGSFEKKIIWKPAVVETSQSRYIYIDKEV